MQQNLDDADRIAREAYEAAPAAPEPAPVRLVVPPAPPAGVLALLLADAPLPPVVMENPFLDAPADGPGAGPAVIVGDPADEVAPGTPPADDSGEEDVFGFGGMDD